MKKLLQPVIKKWYWFLLGAAVLGEAAVFLFFWRKQLHRRP